MHELNVSTFNASFVRLKCQSFNQYSSKAMYSQTKISEMINILYN